MDELVIIMQERMSCIEAIRQQGKNKLKGVHIQNERKRVQRENWMLKVLKSLRVLTSQQKKTIYETTLRLMNFHVPTAIAEIDFDLNYTEEFINAFVQFFNAVTTQIPKTELFNIKSIIRPNNCYIVVDLIKALLELSRNQFKEAVTDIYKESLKPIEYTRRDISLRTFKPSLQRSGLTEPQEDSSSKNDEKEVSVEERIKCALYEKYSKSMDYMNVQATVLRVNDSYNELLDRNNRNANLVRKFREHMLGSRRHINYDISGLYTLQQMKKITEENTRNYLSRLADIKTLRGPCTAQQLREHFKMQVELHQASELVPSLVPLKRRIDWFPLVVLHQKEKGHPLTLRVIDSHGVPFQVDQFQDKHRKTVKAYCRECLARIKGAPQRKKHSDYAFFNRKDYLDYHQLKVLEVLQKEVTVRKEFTLPMLREEEQKEAPRPKMKSSIVISIPPLLQAKQQLESQLERGISYSKFMREVSARDRISEIVDSILKSREQRSSAKIS